MVAPSVSVLQDLVEIAELEERAYAQLDAAAYLRGFVRGPLSVSGRKSGRFADIEFKLAPKRIVRCRCHAVDVTVCETALAGEPIVVDQVRCDDRLTVRRVKDDARTVATSAEVS